MPVVPTKREIKTVIQFLHFIYPYKSYNYYMIKFLHDLHAFMYDPRYLMKKEINIAIFRISILIFFCLFFSRIF